MGESETNENLPGRRHFLRTLALAGASIGVKPLEVAAEELFNPATTKKDEISFTGYGRMHDNKLVSINEDARRMAASTIKNFVMVAFFNQIDAGRIRYNQRVRDQIMGKDLTVKDLV